MEGIIIEQSLVGKLHDLEMRLSAEKGPFYLFALLLRAGTKDKWDLVMAADWIYKNKQQALAEISIILNSEFTQKEVSCIANVALIDRGDPMLASLQQIGHIQHAMMQIGNCTFNKLYINHAFIFTCQGKVFNPQDN